MSLRLEESLINIRYGYMWGRFAKAEWRWWEGSKESKIARALEFGCDGVYVKGKLVPVDQGKTLREQPALKNTINEIMWAKHKNAMGWVDLFVDEWPKEK